MLYDLLLKNGTLVDYVNDTEETCDLAIKDGIIVEKAPDIDPAKSQEVIDITGKIAMPGIVDMHVHASSWLGGKYSHRMMASKGVTTALDMSGPIDSVLDFSKNYGAGLNMASIEYIRPQHTVKDHNPGRNEIQALLESAMHKGSLGLKILGGHYPLTSEATALAIEIACENKAYLAIHAGTLNAGSNLEGFLEIVELSNKHPFHFAHANSYCRGEIKECNQEIDTVIQSLLKNPQIRMESYLSPFNGTSAKCAKGEPESIVTRKALQKGGFAATEAGLEQAILNGWAKINQENGGYISLIDGSDAVSYWRNHETNTTVSFSVNPSDSRIRFATAKRPSGGFVIDAIGTDGGGIPRNVILEHGLSLVKLHALTLKEFVLKSSYAPAKILGLKNKGHLSPGADADITVFDYDQQAAEITIVNGAVIMYKGYVCGRGTNIITTEQGKHYVEQFGLPATVVDIASSDLYQSRTE
ncbi:amidohydrolase family protein [Anaerosinus massiliensis]|uniref:amidohydrolase family protein n=1 Tax=Massilibacillus massiliensis TaxID=1806837 RepID=UPI000AB44761|nr:dihydroorotase family protein [Massilibacillus massiliensis]